MAHTYTEAVTVKPRIASKRRLRLGPNISREKGDDRAGADDSDREPDDVPKRPTKTVLLPHRDQPVNDAG
jgi:hypothetical protein